MRRIVRAKIRYISLVPRGANQMPTIFKNADEQGNNLDLTMLTKAGENFTERGELLACVYAPECRDSQGDIADADVIKSMAYDYLRNGGSIDIRHDEKAVTKEQAHVAESFIIQANDPRFHDFKTHDGTAVDVSGGWGVVIKIDDPELRKHYRDGKWQGVSMGGRAEVRSDFDPVAFAKSVAKELRNPNPSNEDDMALTEDEIKKINQPVIDAFKSLPADIAKAMKGEAPANDDKKKDEDKNKSTPVFKGDYSDANAVQNFIFAQRRAAIINKMDYSDPQSCADGQEQLRLLKEEVEAFKAENGDDTTTVAKLHKAAGITKTDSEELKKAKLTIYKSKQGSNQGGGKGTKVRKAQAEEPDEDEDEEDDLDEDVEKSDADLRKMGERIGNIANGKTPTGK